MSKQWTVDWNNRFLSGDTPWEEVSHSDVLAELLSEYTEGGESILEVGCGLGTNATWMAKQGYIVTALDIAPEALGRAGERANSEGVQIAFLCHDFLADPLPLPPFSVVFDKGCLHSFNTESARNLFVERVKSHLTADGIWITICGSTDTPEDPKEAARNGYPRMSATQIVSLVEPSFEILNLSCCRFGNGGDSDFLAWAGVFQKRPSQSASITPNNRTPGTRGASHRAPSRGCRSYSRWASYSV